MPQIPSLKVEQAEEPIRDSLGQLWSPATILVEWPVSSGQAAELQAPSVRIRVVAAYRPDMTVEELRRAHKNAALNVLSSALLALEEPAVANSELSETGSRR